jgi:hypothetical protein
VKALRLRREVADARRPAKPVRARTSAARRRRPRRSRTLLHRGRTPPGKPRRNPGTREDTAHTCRGPAARRRRQPRPGAATGALETFTQSRTRYDTTHARVTLSRAALASGNERLAIRQGALTRSAVQAMGYGLLCVLYRGRLRPGRAHRRRSDRLCLRRRARPPVGRPAQPERSPHSWPDRTAARTRGMATRRDLRRHGPDPAGRPPFDRPGWRR